ncbi:STY0301 family protein [Salmonella enterica]|uniref:STY0301 family protein n=1 Tax=Salmonella enterica TaxID=28901 RepID=UPI000F6B4D9B|nr:putative cytoplasmic protein [Salmonella enterica subsp. enterica]
MIVKIHFFSTVCLLSIFSFSGNAFAYQLICPASVRLEDKSTAVLKSPPADWEVSSRNTLLLLTSAGITSGKPADLADLIPDRHIKKKLEWDLRYEKKWGTWFMCTYNNEQVLLSRQINPAMNYCQLNYSKDSTGGIGATLTCSEKVPKNLSK